MIDKKIHDFLEERDSKVKNITVIEMVKKFNLNIEEAEDIYNKWRKNYMKPRL